MALHHTTASTLALLRRARAPQEATVRWLRLLAPVALAVFVAAASWSQPRPGLAGRGLVVSICVGLFVLAVLGRNATTGHRRGAAHLGSVAVLLASSAALMWAQPDGPGAAGLLLGVLCVAVLLPVKVAVPTLVAAFVILEVIVGLTNRGFGNLEVLAILAAFYGMLFLAFRLAAANEHAERLLTELRQSQDAQARSAGLAERQRLAREMHDVLAHSLSGLMLQLAGARMLAADDPTDPRLPQTIDRAHHLGKAGLEEARRAIGLLRDDELPGPELLPALAAQFQQDRDIPCGFTVSGDSRQLGSETRLAVYRVAQEALTNITKHARPQRVEVNLAYQASAVRLSVEDFAAHPETPPRPAGQLGTGYGLTGMRERAELLGGTLLTQPTSRGYLVQLDVPA